MTYAAHVDDYSLVPLLYTAKFGEQALANGTCFFYKYATDLYLITNWHNVTGRNPNSLEFLDKKTLGVPDSFQFEIHKKGSLGQWRTVVAQLFFDEERNRPRWLVHPTFRRKVDVVAIKLNLDEASISYPVNDVSAQSDIAERVGEDIFVLGFPCGISGGGFLPIWKRATIATEPQVDRDGLPNYLIDTATRKGMSGAPVVARANSGSYRNSTGSTTIVASGRGVGAPTKFVGIYSGRFQGDSELEAQLGIVWKARVVDEIISGRQFGQPSDYT